MPKITYEFVSFKKGENVEKYLSLAKYFKKDKTKIKRERHYYLLSMF